MDMDAFYIALRGVWVIWMMALFVGIVYWAFKRQNKDRFEDYGNIPFREQD